MNPTSFLDGLESRLGGPAPSPGAPHLRCASLARRVHLAANRGAWGEFDAALAWLLEGWLAGDPALRELTVRHFFPALHLTGMPPENRASALRRMPLPLYREWREMESLMDEARDASD